MTFNVNFSEDFIRDFPGTEEELEMLRTQIQQEYHQRPLQAIIQEAFQAIQSNTYLNRKLNDSTAPSPYPFQVLDDEELDDPALAKLFDFSDVEADETPNLIEQIESQAEAYRRRRTIH